MNFESILRHEDYHEHDDSSDHWDSISSQSTRAAYRMRVLSWILRIYCGYAGMPAYQRAGNPDQSAVADVLQLPELRDSQCSAVQLQQLLWQKARVVLGPLTGFESPTEMALSHDGGGSSRHGEELGLDTVPPAAATGLSNWPITDCPMCQTLTWLAESAGLNPVEQAIFELTVAMRVFQPVKKAVEVWGVLNWGDVPYALSAVLNLPLEDTLAACDPKGALLTSGIVRINRHNDEYLSAMLFVSRTLAENIAYHQGPPQAILAHMAEPLRHAPLSLTDFAHIERHTRLAQSWLAGVLAAAQRGEVAGHLLVTGRPGLGKTEWAAALLLESQTQTLVTVAVSHLGYAITGEDRLTHLRMLMSMMRNTARGVILFDEADDVFRPPASSLSAGSGDKESVSMDNHRASLNHLLDTSRIPVVWIMNRPEVLDPAVLRRFDVEIHFEGIPESVRQALIKARFRHRTEVDLDAELQGHTQEATEQTRWGRVETLTPAMIDRLGRVSERALLAGVPMDAAQCRHWLRQRLPGKPTRHLRIQAATSAASAPIHDPTAWSPDSVNASVDLMELVAGIQKSGTARIALCGAPGTGKTAFAQALARLLDKPLLEQRASDLLSPYVGETEQRICAAFEQAGEDDAVLFIDEVDGLLANREHAVRNWEVTQVNELLEQLGEFEGVVVVATNRLEAIDPAAMRRLDIKIHFEFLKPNQVRAGFERLCQALQLTCSEADLQWVSALSGVTPGDFACVARRLGFAKLPGSASGLITLLEEELALKDPVKQPMGFVGSAKQSSSDSGV
jgi:SpoVK/Ycf46/Vps4 family AAA+-type ATPase